MKFFGVCNFFNGQPSPFSSPWNVMALAPWEAVPGEEVDARQPVTLPAGWLLTVVKRPEGDE
jgi:hypothetical protein